MIDPAMKNGVSQFRFFKRRITNSTCIGQHVAIVYVLPIHRRGRGEFSYILVQVKNRQNDVFEDVLKEEFAVHARMPPLSLDLRFYTSVF